jgi:hypothetical protein
LSLVDGYAEAIRTLANGQSTFRLEADLLGNPFIAGLRTEAWEEGAERKRLREFTEIVEEGRRFRLDTSRGVDDEANLEPRGDEAMVSTRVAERWASERGVRVLDVARRYGQGVSSWPARRFLVLFDRGDTGPDDDQVANLREVVDPPAPLAGPVGTSPVWPNNAARVRAAAVATWPSPVPDPCFWTGVDGPASYKVLCYDSWYQGPGHDKGAELWRDGEADQADLESFGRGVGFALAQAHARTPTTSGGPALALIAADLPAEPLSEVLGPAAIVMAERVELDHALFVELLENEGPLLGADSWSP